VHGGEESLVLELVRVAAAAGGVVGPPVASHSPLALTPLLAHLPAKPCPHFLSLSPAMGGRSGGRVTRTERGRGRGSEGRGGKGGGLTDLFPSIYPFVSLLYLERCS
jgi:hypothetical protein